MINLHVFWDFDFRFIPSKAPRGGGHRRPLRIWLPLHLVAAQCRSSCEEGVMCIGKFLDIRWQLNTLSGKCFFNYFYYK